MHRLAHTFSPADLDVRATGAMMRSVPVLWGFAGGWALDLFLGRVSRPHSDVDLAIFREDQALLHKHLNGWSFEKVIAGRLEVWHAQEHLVPPVHEIHARSPAGHSIEFLINERGINHWIYRRQAAVRLPLERSILRTDSGLPILCPAIVLLYKAKSHTQKDEHDFQAVRGAMGRDRRIWLHAALSKCHAGHPWLHELEAA